MATDFFERQAAARRTTKWMLVVFVLAVILLVGATVLVAMVVVDYGSRAAEPGSLGVGRGLDESTRWQIPLWAGGGSLALIVGGTLYKIAQLAGGGTVVAERLGGRRVYPNTTDATERRLLNVVEEMALASGVPVPPVFLLNDERGLNAFAAGFSPSDAVIGVTRGAAEQLSRDELQGVMAHEFSHILNGDMRLNLRMIGVLHGILLLGLVGREILRVAARSGGGRGRKNNGVLYVLAIGLALMILGFLGSLVGNLIKAAVSRQREFLADASAVQFTRNPGGIAGALKRIGGAIFGSRLVAPAAAEASHMYFSQGVWQGITGLMNTHPRLDVRIRRLDPQWDGKYPEPLPSDFAAGRAFEEAAGLVGAEIPAKTQAIPAAVMEHAAQQVANPSEAHRLYAAELVAAMPPALVESVHEPYGARAVIFASLLDRDADIRAAQLKSLEQHTDPQVFELTLRLTKYVSQLDVRARLPLVDMSLPALRAMSEPQYREFIQCFHALVEADERIALFEWTLHQILLRHLRPQYEPVKRPPIVYYGLQRLGEPISVLLTALARASQGEDRRAFEAGAAEIPNVAVRLLDEEVSGLKRLNDALVELAKVAPPERRRLIDACAATICADAKVTVKEGELLRAIGDMLDCPLPPLLAGQRVAAWGANREDASGVDGG
jgi:Zn-dependent protease with chaperone function